MSDINKTITTENVTGTVSPDTAISTSISDSDLSATVTTPKISGSVSSIDLVATMDGVIGTESDPIFTEWLGTQDGNDFVPYTGASQEVDLNSQDLTTTGTVEGVNITSGENPGHTHTSSAITDLHLTKNESFEITQPILNQKYVELTNTITDINSIRVFVDDVGLIAQPGVDYSISDQYVYWTGYDFFTKLALGETLRIFYK